MRSLRIFRILRFAALLCGLGISFFGFPKSTAAQSTIDDECFDVEIGCDVEGFAEILPSTSNTEVDAWTYTLIWNFDLLDAGDEAYVEGNLYKDSTQIGYVPGYDDGSGYAEADIAASVSSSHVYQWDGDHYLVGAIGDLGGEGFNYVGSTFTFIYNGPPHIDSFSPSYGYVGTSGYITVQGYAFFDPFTGQLASASFGSGTGLTLSSVGLPNGSELVLQYSIAQNATTGPVSIVLQTQFGISTSTQTFNVGDPPPVITSVSPAVWAAGAASLPIVISGSGFGTSPTVSVGGDGTALVSVGSTSDTSISATVSVASGAQNGAATVAVTSNGYAGSSFFGANPGEPQTAFYNVAVQTAPAPAPQIQLYGQTITTTQSMVVGQLIALSALISLPQGQSICQQQWSTPPGTAIGGYTYYGSNFSSGTAGAAVTPLPNLSSGVCTTTPLSVNFYWVDGGNSRQITYTYTTSNGQSNSATATFNVDSPSGVQVSAVQTPVTIPPPPNSISPGTNPLLMEGSIGVIGTKLTATASHLPSGQYEWVQLLNNNTTKILNSAGIRTCVPGPFPQLDGAFPYGYSAQGQWLGTVYQTTVPNDTSQDSPATSLPPSWGEVARSFGATTYLMWAPNPDSRCESSSCTLLVPLGTVQWQWAGDAIDTQIFRMNMGDAYPVWMPNLTTDSHVEFQPSHPSTDPNNSFPVWGANNVDPGGLGSCH